MACDALIRVGTGRESCSQTSDDETATITTLSTLFPHRTSLYLGSSFLSHLCHICEQPQSFFFSTVHLHTPCPFRL